MTAMQRGGEGPLLDDDRPTDALGKALALHGEQSIPMATRSNPSLSSVPPDALTPRRTSFTPPPAELTGFLAIPREPEVPSTDACGKRFYMEMDWSDRAEPASQR